jgi:hypothetical protein
MNSKNTRKNSAKSTPKKKVKSNAKANPPTNETKSKFYVTQDGQAKTKEQPKVVESKKIVVEEPKKLERSNSFYLTRKLSQIYTKLSGSKENLDKIKDSEKSEVTPFKFQRSLTLNSIQLKKSYRKTFPENRLEKLSEEKLGENEKFKSPPLSPDVHRSRSPTTYRQSMPPGSFDSVDHSFLKPPQKLERSDSFISLIRRKISFNDVKPSSMNSSWATSLQSLQQIDNMVSYEDLSFVDYDKFNQYERQIDKMINRLQAKISSSPNETLNSVVRRRKKPSNRMMGDFNSNLDRDKNVYRQSIDSNKLQFLSTINLETHRWNLHNNPIDWLSLENTPQVLKPIL